MRILLCLILTGCVFQGSSGGPSCPLDTSYEVDTGATIDHVAGIDAGYYITYAGAGHWHIEWTCDTKLSATGCNFTGAITTTAPATATCFQCEAEDRMTVTPGVGSTTVEFDTITTSGIDGVDITTTPGSAIHIDLLIDGLYQNDLVFVPSRGRAATADCNPVDLVPSTP